MPTISASFTDIDLLALILNRFKLATSITRLFHGRGHCYPGYEHLSVDFYPPFIYCRFFKKDENISSLMINEFGERLKIPLVIHNIDENDFAFINISESDASEHISLELELKYLLKVGKNQNIGFFPDMLKAREWMIQNKEYITDKKVLNLFAYTCSISVVAKNCGACEIHNVDLSSSFLSWGRENHRLNFDNNDEVFFHKKDILKSLGFFSKKGPFDFIFFDPPSYQKGSFDYKKDYLKVVRRLSEICSLGGIVFACLNTPFESDDFVMEQFANNAPNFKYIQTLYSPQEFEEMDKNNGVKICIFKKES